MDLEFIEATTLPDAWFQCIYNILEKGRKYVIDRGSYAGQQRLEFDYITIHIKHPHVRPLLPEIPAALGIPNPVEEGYLDQYLPYLMTGELEKNESYSYGQRFTRFPVELFVFSDNYDEITKMIIIDEIDQLKEEKIIFFDEELEKWCLNQIELVIWIYKNKGFKNNQMVLQVAHPNDMLLKDPPCLRQIGIKIESNKLHFIADFRSWDLWSGSPANLAGIQLVKEYMVGEMGIEDGEIIASSKGMHLYSYVKNLAEIRTGKKW